jgi:hypothetical protein
VTDSLFISNQYIFAISSIQALVSLIILDMNISAMVENIEFASSKYCKTAIFPLVKTRSSSVKLSQK